MKRRTNKMVEELISYWKNYVFQSLLVALTTFVVLLFLSLQEAVIVASIGATAFIVFAMPNSVTARPRNVIGGHLVGLLCGTLFALIQNSSFLYSAVAYSLSVGLSIFIMVVIDTEHPPASGTALGVAITGFSAAVVLAVMTSAVVLSLVRYSFRRYLRDLT